MAWRASGVEGVPTVPKQEWPSAGYSPPMSSPDLLILPAVEQARLIRTGAVSSEELTRLYLERIERLNPSVSAFVNVFRGRARRAARRKVLRRRWLPGPLPPFHGVPIGMKDLNLV